MTIQPYDLSRLASDLAEIRTKKRAAEIVGGLSKPSKMPGPAYNLPASACKVGSKLRHVPGSTCFKCYAADTVEWQQQGGRMQVVDGKLRGSRYATESVQKALARRLSSLSDPLWTPAMILLIGRGVRYFRWHDSGDIQSAEHFYNICCVVAATPAVKHWLPTREKRMLRDGVKLYGELPRNLVLRASAHMVDAPPPKSPQWPLASMVTSTGAAPKGVRVCPAPTQGNQCGDCRACWDKRVKAIAYHAH